MDNTPDGQIVDLSKQVAADLFHALTEEPFPIRGWEISILQTPILDRSYYALHEVSSENLPIKDEVVEPILTSHIKTTATFQFNRPIVLFGKTVDFSPVIKDNQLLHLMDEDQTILISFDPKMIRPYSDECYMVDGQTFAYLCEKYFNLGRKNKVRSKQMLAQLAQIKVNCLSALHQSLGRLAGAIAQNEPDYWDLIEKVAKRKITPDVAMKQSRGALLITQATVQ